jgi:molecular chaperone HscB
VISLSDDDFALMGLTRRFQLESKALDERWKELQRLSHPDRFAAQGLAAQRLAMQWSVRVNEAHQRLRDPIRRAAYLCELRGAPIEAESNTSMPAEFLLQQLQWREAMEETGSAEQAQALLTEVLRERQQSLDRLNALLDGPDTDPVAASAVVRALLFTERFVADVQDRLDRWQT